MALLADVEPVYTELRGWNRSLAEIREPADLPAEAQAFLHLVETEVGVPIRIVGVGAERDDYLLWDRPNDDAQLVGAR
jgi:adenylosuccinate synthase